MRIQCEGIGTVWVIWIKNPRLRWYWGSIDFSSEQLRFEAHSDLADMCLGIMAIWVMSTEGWAQDMEHLSVGVGKRTRRALLQQQATPHRTVPTTFQQQCEVSGQILLLWCFKRGAKPLHQISALILWYFIGSMWRLSEQNHWTWCL